MSKNQKKVTEKLLKKVKEYRKIRDGAKHVLRGDYDKNVSPFIAEIKLHSKNTGLSTYGSYQEIISKPELLLPGNGMHVLFYTCAMVDMIEIEIEKETITKN